MKKIKVLVVGHSAIAMSFRILAKKHLPELEIDVVNCEAINDFDFNQDLSDINLCIIEIDFHSRNIEQINGLCFTLSRDTRNYIQLFKYQTMPTPSYDRPCWPLASSVHSFMYSEYLLACPNFYFDDLNPEANTETKVAQLLRAMFDLPPQ